MLYIDALQALLPTVAMPYDHFPVVVDLAFRCTVREYSIATHILSYI